MCSVKWWWWSSLWCHYQRKMEQSWSRYASLTLKVSFFMSWVPQWKLYFSEDVSVYSNCQHENTYIQREKKSLYFWYRMKTFTHDVSVSLLAFISSRLFRRGYYVASKMSFTTCRSPNDHENTLKQKCKLGVQVNFVWYLQNGKNEFQKRLTPFHSKWWLLNYYFCLGWLYVWNLPVKYIMCLQTLKHKNSFG